MSLNGCLVSTERGGWRGVGRKGWQRVGEGLAKGWQRVGGFPCTLQFRNSRGARLEKLVCDSMASVEGTKTNGHQNVKSQNSNDLPF